MSPEDPTKPGWFVVVMAGISVTVMALVLYLQLRDLLYGSRIDDLRAGFKTEKDEQAERERLIKIIDEKLKGAIATVPERVETAAFNQKMKELDDKITTVQQQTLGVRQAMNPSKPDEILTIARLTDELKMLRKDMDVFQTTVAAQQKLFQESVLREITSSNASTNLILIVLIPLVLNFLYTLWKDFRAPKTT